MFSAINVDGSCKATHKRSVVFTVGAICWNDIVLYSTSLYMALDHNYKKIFSVFRNQCRWIVQNDPLVLYTYKVRNECIIYLFIYGV